MIAVAVDGAVDSGGLYFTSAGNSGYGWKFMSVSCVTWLDPSNKSRVAREAGGGCDRMVVQ